MSDYDMAYFDVKLFVSQYTTGVLYKGLYIEMDESSTFAYTVYNDENCGEKLDSFISIQEAIQFIDEAKSDAEG
ncbi:hypothetical protein QLH32_04845 [Acinetobacter corruptisaponis]|uniref:Phage protein n=1 Tax=Acinetobacter corruptisaponis TaxID=3045147 RepID=A0ABY8S7W1_9GAMM|nr:hypothetical protein [Acinetobacter sp. KCTC 92772]WHP06803.1 hypothetical protein QLH32_04845 [Acinetobacter sp. KCTC 92772]